MREQTPLCECGGRRMRESAADGPLRGESYCERGLSCQRGKSMSPGISKTESGVLTLNMRVQIPPRIPYHYRLPPSPHGARRWRNTTTP